MRKSLVLALVAALLLVAPRAGFAVASFTLDLTETVSPTGISSSLSINKKGLDLGSVSLKNAQFILELTEIQDNLESPHHNVASISSAGNVADVSGNTGLVTVQQQAGVANVSLSVNSIITGQVTPLGSGFAQGTFDGTLLYSIVLNPGFSILNSFKVIEVLLVREAFAAAAAAGTGGVALDVRNLGVNEFSPHHNALELGVAFNPAVISGSQGIVTVQQHVGVANVQMAVNQFLLSSATLGSVGLNP